MTETVKKRGRPRKKALVEGAAAPKAKMVTADDVPVAEPVPEAEKVDPAKFVKRPSMDAKARKIVITVSPDGPRHIEGGGFNVYELWEILSGCTKYLAVQVQKIIDEQEAKGTVENEDEVRPTDAPGGSDT